ncbi:MAG: hypothetical protein WD555_03310 [Fulvivirga sp.]
MKTNILSLLLPTVVMALFSACNSKAQQEEYKSYGEIALEESAVPVRPGIPSERPFWNNYSKRFIYAPAFDFNPIENAEEYRFDIISIDSSTTYSFEANKPHEPLTPVWVELTEGSYHLTVTGVANDGKDVGVAGEREFYRAAPFNGIYHEPVLPYDTSAMVALKKLLDKDYIQYWFKHKSPDPGYGWYRYPAKIYSALVIGAVTQARLEPGTPTAEGAIALARIVADELIAISFPKGAPLEYFPPTYHGYPEYFKDKESHMSYERSMIIHGADAGHAYLDLYDLVGDEKYLDAAKRIAQTYLKTQLSNGSWYLYVNNKTGNKIESNIAIPTSTINYFDRLRKDYEMTGLDQATEKAFAYIMANPVKTFNWQGQFEDISARKPYQNQSREQACDLAIYLFRNSMDDSESIKLAEELIRFSEDQFVIWEEPQPKPDNGKAKGALPQNWITPCVQEQYAYWRPIARSAGIMIDTYWEAYKVTGNEMYLAKAKSIANSFTVVQEAHDGDYPTHFTEYKMNFWLNNAVYPAKVMMNFEKNLTNDK